ncbi:DUF3754 domain-containing protein [Pseudoalteromonas sp. MMG010]|uniref:TMEM143 family protein n=1 Tax=Pseudoalteromonas sp. MMG010 TaxID=2822685 RepID=UPI001B39FED7|nr:TMEM143 family protein [Pseudoalteromonas sp. MMG010]MBQ4832179.1 DUF3754 domain-containing protein [Pseudoalteromonas sp. MMG010]
MPNSRFIPFKKQDIIKICTLELAIEEHASFTQLCHLLASLVHYDYHSTLESLKSNYTPFDPNNDTRSLTSLSNDQKTQCQQAFAKDFAKVLNSANFERITDQDLQDALNEESLFNVRLAVEFDDFAEVVFYRRGESQKTETLSRLWGLSKKKLHFTNYDRVAVFIRFKDHAYFANKDQKNITFEPGSTIVKLFQNVPKADLEMLFPNSEVRMRPIDKAIIASSAIVGGAIVLITKLGASLVLLFAMFAFWGGLRDEHVTMTQQHFITLAVGTGVFGSFIFKEWSKFKNRKIKFMKALSDNLYFKNLDNNAGVFHTLIDAAEEEDIKEAVIAYTFLLKSKTGLTADALDNQIENWFKTQYHCNLNFEIADAIDKLVRMRLISCTNNIYTALSIEHAKNRLDEHWDNLFQYH